MTQICHYNFQAQLLSITIHFDFIFIGPIVNAYMNTPEKMTGNPEVDALRKRQHYSASGSTTSVATDSTLL